MQFNIFAFAAILLAGETLASKVNYVSTYHGKNLKGEDEVMKEKKAGGKIDDDKDDDVLKNIGTWSNGKCHASQHAPTKIITVTNAGGTLASKSAASDRNNECQQFVNKNTKRALAVEW